MFFSAESYGLSTAAGKIPYVPIQFYDADDSCPFAAKAWLTLLEKGLNFERITINLKNKPQEFTYLYTSLNPDPAAKAKVPLIVGGAAVTIPSLRTSRRRAGTVCCSVQCVSILLLNLPLADGTNKVVESNLVAEYLDNSYPDAGPKLFPSDPMQQFKVIPCKALKTAYGSALPSF